MKRDNSIIRSFDIPIIERIDIGYVDSSRFIFNLVVIIKKKKEKRKKDA